MTKIDYVNISSKHSDMFEIQVYNDQGDKILSREGYAPNIKGVANGDYSDISIDNETGCIIGWVPLTNEDIERMTND